MPLRNTTGLAVALAVLTPAVSSARPLPPPIAQEVENTEEDDLCNEAITEQDWDQVIAICEPLVSGRDESHPNWETHKGNVDFAYQTRCVAAAQASDWETTLASCGPTLAAYPDSFQIHLFMGLAHQNTGNAREAIASLEAFLAGAAADPAMAEQLTQQIELARQQRSAALQKLMTDDRAAAIPLLRSAAASDPSDAEVHFRLGYALLQDQDNEGAEDAFGVVIALSPDIPQLPQVLFLAGQLAYNRQDYETADERLSRYLELAPEEERAGDANYMLAFIAGRAEDQSRMTSYYRAALELAPDHPQAKEANFSLGVVAFNADQCNSAQRYLRRFMSLAGNDPRRAQVDEWLLDIEDGLCGGPA